MTSKRHKAISLIADDRLAVTCQTLGQYRAMILKELARDQEKERDVCDNE